MNRFFNVDAAVDTDETEGVFPTVVSYLVYDFKSLDTVYNLSSNENLKLILILNSN